MENLSHYDNAATALPENPEAFAIIFFCDRNNLKEHDNHSHKNDITVGW